MAIEPARCGTITSEMYEMECVRSAEHDYAEGQTERDRKEWLMANGCPPAMAER